MGLYDRDYWKEKHGKNKGQSSKPNVKLDPKIWNPKPKQATDTRKDKPESSHCSNKTPGYKPVNLDPKIWNSTRSQKKAIDDKYLIAFGLVFIGFLLWLVFKPLYL